MTDLLDEVKDDLRDENTFNFIKKYGRAVILFMAITVIAISCNMWWQSYQMNKIYQEGGEFIIAAMKMRSNKLDEAINDLSTLAKSGSTIYSTLAQIDIASYQQHKKNFKSAKENYLLASQKKANDSILKHYIDLMTLKAELSEPNNNKEELLAKAKKISLKDNPFKLSIYELIASLEITLNKQHEALETISKIKDNPNTPLTIKNRIGLLEELLS